MSNSELFDELIVAAGKLATVADQAAVVLSEEFESLVRPSIDHVRSILDRCPMPVIDRDSVDELREEDLEVTTYMTLTQPSNLGPVGVKIVHLPTGIGRQSESKPTQLENREVAMKALRKALLHQ